MLQTVGDLIRSHNPLATVHLDDSLREAVKVMYENGYGQVPVINERGRVEGMFTEHALTRAFHLGIASDLLDTPVSGFMENAGKVAGQSTSVFEVARLLSQQRAVVIGSNNVPIGIVTDHDIARYLAEWSEGVGLVEDIEERLRGYIERVFWTQDMLGVALRNSLGRGKDYSKLSLGDHIRFIIHEDNWAKFEPYLKPLSVFKGLLDNARAIRNKIAHLRGPLTRSELETLHTTVTWLASCPKVPKQLTPEVTTEPQAEDIASHQRGGKYAPLYKKLLTVRPDIDTVSMPFTDIEKVLNDRLPPTAYTYREWWANSPNDRSRQCAAWINAGWRVTGVDFTKQEVTFGRTSSKSSDDEVTG